MTTHVSTDAIREESLWEKHLKTGLKTPVDTTPNMMVPKNGAISLPRKKMEIQNSARKKKKTAR